MTDSEQATRRVHPADESADSGSVRCDGGLESATGERHPRPEGTQGTPGERVAGSGNRAADERHEGTRVLHVDDDPRFGDLVATFLERTGDLTVLTETDAVEALDRLAGSDVDCVVTDVEMPGMDGLELLRAVEARHPKLPVLLFTSRPRDAVGDGADRAAGYVRKAGGPRQFEALARDVRSAVE